MTESKDTEVVEQDDAIETAPVEAAPEAVAEAAPEAAEEAPVEAAPEPVVEAAPELVVEAAPEPVVEAAPEPVVEAAPEPAVEAAPPKAAPPVAAPAPVAEAAAEASTDDLSANRHRRQMVGTVVSTKGEKTAVVSVTRTFLHPQARKYVRRSKKYMAHDEHGICAEGDEVLIEQCRPLSKHKRWRLRKVVRQHA